MKKHLIFILFIFIGCGKNSIKEKSDHDFIREELELSVEELLYKRSIKNVSEVFKNGFEISHPPLFEYGVDSENNGILVSKNSEPVLFYWNKQMIDSVYEFQVLSEKIRLNIHLRVGMTVKEVLEYYPNISLEVDALYGFSECFYIQDEYLYLVQFLSNENTRVGKYLDENTITNEILDLNRKIDKISVRKLERTITKQTATEEESVNDEEVNNCVFSGDVKSSTLEAITQYDSTLEHQWLESENSAIISIGQDSVVLSIGGCDHYSYSAEIFNNEYNLTDTIKILDKVKWIASRFFSNTIAQTYQQAIDENRLITSSNSTSSSLEFEFPTDTILTNYVYQNIQIKKTEIGTVVLLSVYIN